MLRRKQPIVLRDDPETDEFASLTATRPATDRARFASLQSEAPAAASEEHQEPATPPAGAKERLSMLRGQLDENPISRGSPHTLEALRAKFHQTLDLPADEEEQPAPGFKWPLAVSPLRLLLIIVALGAGGAAAWLALSSRPAPIVEPVAAPPPPPPAPVMAQVLVAQSNITAGTRVTAEALVWQDWPVDAVRAEYITIETQPEAMSEMAGAIVRSTILAGEPIRSEMLAARTGGVMAALLEPGMRAAPVAISPRTSSGGFIAPGDSVDVVLTRTMADGRRVTDTILHNVLVLALDSSFASDGVAATEGEEASFKESVLALLSLGPLTAEAMMQANTMGDISLMVRPAGDTPQVENDAVRASNLSIRLSSPFWNSPDPAAAER